MTKLLDQAFAKASSLPEIDQNILAKWLLDELAAEKQWTKIFADSEDVLDKIADEALEEHRQGMTRPLDPDSL